MQSVEHYNVADMKAAFPTEGALPHVKASYTIFARKLKSGKVYYFQTYDPNGRRLPARSTGKRTRSEARQFCDALLKAERLTSPDCPTLEAWVKDRNFYEWDKESPEPKCLYAQIGRASCRERV